MRCRKQDRWTRSLSLVTYTWPLGLSSQGRPFVVQKKLVATKNKQKTILIDFLEGQRIIQGKHEILKYPRVLAAHVFGSIYKKLKIVYFFIIYFKILYKIKISYFAKIKRIYKMISSSFTLRTM